MKKVFVALLWCVQVCSPLESAANRADITILTADLKYNSEKGIKICEIQKGSESSCDINRRTLSHFKGHEEYSQTPGFVIKALHSALAKYNKHLWFVRRDFCESRIPEKFISVGWQACSSLNNLLKRQAFNQRARESVDDPSAIASYHGMMWCAPESMAKRIGSSEQFYALYPGVLAIDGAIFPYNNDKLKMTSLLESDEKLKQIKPRWGHFNKEYHQKLASEIKREIPSDYLVIKPLHSAYGDGVIILASDDLDDTLQLIFHDKKRLETITDSSYSQWLEDEGDQFLVEEFVPSDPLTAPHINNLVYDPTLRISFMLSYDQGNIEVTFLGCFLETPKKIAFRRGLAQ